MSCHGYKLFEQDGNFAILKDKNVTLSNAALEQLETAFMNAQFNRGEWGILSWQSKIAHIVSELVDTLIGEKDWQEELKEPTWEAIKFVKKYVYDVHPFRDNSPD